MPKSTVKYWNPLDAMNADKWESVEGSDGMLEQITIAEDPISGDYTRLTRFKAGADTKKFGEKFHDYPEEVFILSGRLFDKAFDIWLEQGYYASRPPGEVHGPFIAESECIVLEMSFPSQAIRL